MLQKCYEEQLYAPTQERSSVYRSKRSSSHPCFFKAQPVFGPNIQPEFVSKDCSKTQNLEYNKGNGGEQS